MGKNRSDWDAKQTDGRIDSWGRKSRRAYVYEMDEAIQ